MRLSTFSALRRDLEHRVSAAWQCQCCMSMFMPHIHVHATYPCPCCKSMSALQKSMSMLYVPVKQSFMSMSPCCISMLHVHATYPCCMLMLHVYAACPCCLSMLHVYVCVSSPNPLCLFMSILHVHVSMLCVYAPCPCSMSMMREHAACHCCLSMLRKMSPGCMSKLKVQKCDASLAKSENRAIFLFARIREKRFAL
jgi:hypothetical protein